MMHGGRGHNILLVDDEEIFLSSLFDGLRRRFPDMTFRTAHNGEAALATLDQHPVDLVITDLKMPKMDGFQLIAAMHSQYPAIPLLIMTAHSTELSEGRAMASGALHCIDKPVDLAELSRRIDELFSTGAIASLRGVSLPAFLQLLGLEKKSGIVDVQGEGVRGRLYLSGGQIIHADNGSLTGLPAALRTVCLEDVAIHFRPGAVPKTPTIDLPLTQILLDAARQNDEGVRDATEDFDDLAFSESFSDAFDEQLGKLESPPASGEDAASLRSTPQTEAVTAKTAAVSAAPEPIADEIPPLPGILVPSGAPSWKITPPSSPEVRPVARPDIPSVPLRHARPGPTGSPMRTSDSSGPVISGTINSPAILPVTTPISTPRLSTALPIPRPQSALSASARAAVLTPPGGRPALPRPPSVRPRSPTDPVVADSAEVNVSDAVASCLRKIAEIGGVLGAAFIDFHSGETLGAITRSAAFATVASARANLEMVRAKIALMSTLGLVDTIEDIVITTRTQYHLVCMNERRPRQFVFVALAREDATLALARFLIDEAVESASAGSAAS